MIKGAKTIAEYAIRKWINQNFYCDCVHITEMHGNEAFIKDKTGDCMIVVYDPSVIMLVDEEGLVKGLSENALGCALYGTARHGYPIVGDLIFGIVVGEDIVGPENPEAMIES